MSQPKRSFFKKPAWKEEQARERELNSGSLINPLKPEQPKDATDLFIHSVDSPAQIRAEMERKLQRKKEKAEKKAVKQEEKTKARMDAVVKSIAIADEDDIEQPPAKRARISCDSVQTDGSGIISPLSPITSPEIEEVPRRKRPPESEVIDLEEYAMPDTPLGVEQVVENDHEDEEEEDNLDDLDPEIAELVRQARESEKRRAEKQDKDEDDPIVEIFIEPQIPDTVPLMVKRRYNQTFKAVRNAWCEHNKLDAKMNADVYFTWRGEKVYDTSRFSTLGITLDIEGLPVLKTARGYSERHDRLHLVATTDAIQQEEKRKAAEEEARAKAEAERAFDPPPPEKKFRVILRSKAYDDHKLIIKLSTEMRKVMNSYRTQFHIPKDASMNIMFDGDILDPDDQVKDTELADWDSNDPILLDVSIKEA